MDKLVILSLIQSVLCMVWLCCTSEKYPNSFVMKPYIDFIRFIDKSKTMKGKVVYSVVIALVTLIIFPLILCSGIILLIKDFIKNNYDL